MLHTFIQTLKKLRPTPVLLGRWCRTDKNLNDVKVDLANVDHCGTCVHEKLAKTETRSEVKGRGLNSSH
jgi:hypothetical protein